MTRPFAQDHSQHDTASPADYRRLIAQALAAIESQACRPGVPLSGTAAATDWFRLKLAGYEHEVFAAAWLDNRNRLIAFEELFRGTLNAISVPVREVVKAALKHNAGAVLFAHNHPSGSATASGEDVVLTIELARALDLVDVRVLDHFVITAAEPPRSVWAGIPPSMRQTGALPQSGSKRAEARKQKRAEAANRSRPGPANNKRAEASKSRLVAANAYSPSRPEPRHAQPAKRPATRAAADTQ